MQSPATSPNTTPANATPPARPSRRAAWFGALLVVGGVVLALGMAEIMLRLVDPNYYVEMARRQRFIEGIHAETPPGRQAISSFYLRPGADVEFLGARFQINEAGFRNPPIEPTKPADVYRIAVIGDSVPFGWGVPEPDCFPRRLEQLLNERDRPFGKQRVEVLNLSGPGRGLLDYYLVLRDDGLRLDPDLVLIPFIFNDVPLELVATDPATAPPPPWTPPAGLRWSYTARFVCDAIDRFRHPGRKGEYWIGIHSTPAALRLACQGFDLLQQLAGEVPLVIFDTVGERPGKPIPEIVECTARLGIPRIECFLPVDDWDEWCIQPPIHTHPNVRAHHVYAETIVAWLEAQQYLK